jgi:hypothetical protein
MYDRIISPEAKAVHIGGYADKSISPLRRFGIPLMVFL